MADLNILVFDEVYAMPDGWHGVGWSDREKYKIPKEQITGTHADFPALVHITSNYLRDKARSDGYDILFTDLNGNKLDHEIEDYDNSTGELWAWVKLTSATSASDGYVWMYCGNPDATDQQNASGVWSDFSAVWHLNNSLLDSSGNGHTLTNTGSVDIAGKIADGQDFESGDNDYLTAPDSPEWDFGSEDITLSMWIKKESQQGANNNFVMYRSSTGSFEFMGESVSATSLAVRFWCGTPSVDLVGDESPVGTWQLITLTRVGDTFTLYQDDAQTATEDDSSAFPAGTTDLKIGGQGVGTTNFWDGIIDEVRVIKGTGHSANWVATEYANQNSPSTFFVFQTHETREGADASIGVGVDASDVLNILEDVTVDLDVLNIELAENLTITESAVEAYLDEMNTSVFEDFLITESVSVVDLVVEVGVVADTLSIAENLGAYLDALFTDVCEEIGVVDSDSYTKLLLHFDGTDGATSSYDSSPSGHALTFDGDAQLDTAQKKFGPSSLILDGNGDYLTSPDDADWDLGTDDFTLECCVRFNSFSSTQYRLVGEGRGVRGSGPRESGWSLLYDRTAGNLVLDHYDGGSQQSLSVSWTPSPSTATWYHVAVTRSGDDVQFWVDGTQVGTTQDATGIVYNRAESFGIYMGRFEFGATSVSYLDGWVDELRISKGVARWTAAFTPPTEAYDATPVALDLSIGVDVSDTVSITEDVEVVDITVEMPLVFGAVAVTEDLTAVLDVLNLDVNDTAAVTEYVELLDLVVGVPVVFDEPGVLEDVTLSIDALNANVSDTVTITESVSVVDIVVEVGVVAETVGVTESATTSLDALYIEESEELTITETVSADVLVDVVVFDIASVEENVQLLDIVVDLPVVFDTVVVVENTVLTVEGALGVFDTATVTENVVVSVDVLNIGTFDAVGVVDVPGLNDLVVELGPAVDLASVSENITAYLDSIHLSVYDEATATESVTVLLGELQVATSDTVTITESVSVVDLMVEIGIVADTSAVSESVTVSLDELYASVFDAVATTESVSTDVLMSVSVFDSIGVVENVQLHDIVIDLPVVFDAVAVLENIEPYMGMDINVNDDVTTTESAAVSLGELNVDIFDTVSIAEVPLLTDLVVEVGPAVDLVTVLEDVTSSLDQLNLLVFDEPTITEDVTPLLDALVPSVFDTSSVVENVTMEDLGLNFLAFDVATVAESMTQYLDVLNFLVLDPFHVLITESVSVVDLVVEVGVVMDPVSVTESATVGLDVLNLSVYDVAAAAEWVHLLDITVELSAFDLAAAVESVELSITELYLAVYDEGTVAEYVELLDIILELPLSYDEVTVLEELTLNLDLLNVSVGEDLLVTEVVVTHDLVIELGVVADVVGAVENVGLLPDALFLAVSDDVLAAEATTVLLPELVVAVSENVAHSEYVELLDITIELPVVYDIVAAVENVTLTLPELYLQAGEDVSVAEVALMTDLVVELGPAVDLAVVTENVTMLLDVLVPEVSDNVGVAEWVQLLDLVIDLAVYDEITTTESASAFLSALNIVAGDDVLVTESVSVVDLVIEIGVVAETVSVADVVEDVTTNSGEIPYCCQSAAWFDGTYYWRAWFNRTGGYIQVDYTTDPDNAWAENTGARISDSNVLNDFSIYAKASSLVIVYTQGGDVLIREATSYPSTSFAWSAANTIWTDVSKTYSRPNISRTQSNRYWASATEKDGAKQYAVVKRSGPGNITSWDSAATLGDTNNEGESFSALMHSLPLSPPTNFQVVCAYVEGTQLQYKEFDGTWDASPTNIAVLKISPQSLVAHQFELNFDDVNGHVDMVYVKSDGTCISREWEPVGGLGAEVVLDANTDCEHPGIGTFGDYLVFAWDRPHGDDNNQFYVRLLHKTGHILGPILAMAETTATMTRSDVSKTEDESHSCFIYWEEASTVFTRTLEIGLDVSDTITVAEWVFLLDLFIDLEVSEIIAVVEDVQLLDIVIEMPLVFDEVATTEDVTAYLDVLSLSLSDQVSIAEVAIMTDIVIELGPATEEVALTENVTVGLDVLNVDVSDALNIVEWVSLLDIVIDLPVVFDVVTVTEQATAYLDELFLNVFDTVTVAEVVLMTDIMIELGPVVDLVAVTEQADVSLGFLNVSESETLTVTEWANLLDITVELFVFDTSTVVEWVNLLDITVELAASDEAVATETITVSLDALFVAAGDDIVATEAVVLHDIIVELSVSEDLTVVENANVALSEFFISVSDTLTVTEWTYLLDIIIELPVLSEDITVVEDLTVLLPELCTEHFEIIAVTDVAVMHDLIIELGIVTEVVTLSEYVELLDLTVELEAFEALEVLENVGLVLDELFLQAGEDVTVTEDVEVVDITIELGPVFDDVAVTDVVVDLRLDVLNFFVVQPMMIVINEVAQVVDLVIEVGIVAEYNFVAEFAEAYPDVLVPSVSETVTTVEWIFMDREMIIDVSDSVATSESFEPDMPLNFEAAEGPGGVQIVQVSGW